jgi:hypothetical protein
MTFPAARNAGMSEMKLDVLLVEDNSADAELVLRELRRGSFDVTSYLVQTAEEFRRRLRDHPPKWFWPPTTWGNGEEWKRWTYCKRKIWISR